MKTLRQLSILLFVQTLCITFLLWNDHTLRPSPAVPADAEVLAEESVGVYWVSPDGSDTSGDGSESQPWKSIQHAIDTVPNDSIIKAKPGEYFGKVRFTDAEKHHIRLISAEPYRAKILFDSKVIGIDRGTDISIEGFEITHASNTSPDTENRYLIQVKDLMGTHSGDANGDPVTSNIVIKNNIIHDSRNSDLLKLEKAAKNIYVTGNMFYNQGGPDRDHHIDVNSVEDVFIENNLFFNDFASSGRTPPNISAFLVIKDSSLTHGTGPSCDERCDDLVGAQNIVVRRNIFAQWADAVSSLADNPYVALGEEEQNFHVAKQVLIENNLFLGNKTSIESRGYFTFQSVKDINIRNNTFSGDLPSLSFIGRFRANNSHPDVKSEGMRFANNIFSDSAGTFGCRLLDCNNARLFSTSTSAWSSTPSLNSNIYWNAAGDIPVNASEALNYVDDSGARVGDPALLDPTLFSPPYWQQALHRFNGGYDSIAAAFSDIAVKFSAASSVSAVQIDAADRSNSPETDILGRERGSSPDAGAYENSQEIVLNLLAVDDAYIHGARLNRTKNYGRSEILQASKRNPKLTYIKFHVADIVGKDLDSAHLKLHVSSSASGVHKVTTSSSNWQEEDLNFRNAPEPDYTSGDVRLPTVNSGDFINVDVTDLVEGNTRDYLTVVIYSTVNDTLSVHSKEYSDGVYRPQLSVIYTD